MTTLSLHKHQVQLENNFTTPAFTFTVNQGEHVLIAGRNRAGKSLLIAALAGRGRPLAGSRTCEVSVAEVSVAVQQALILEEIDDVEPILKEAKRLSELEPGKEFRHAAVIPEFVVRKAFREGWFNDSKAWKDWANDPDNALFRTWHGEL